MADVFSLSEVQQSFAAFAEAKGSCIDLAYADDRLMIARCVLPVTFEVQVGDVHKGGIAVRATLKEVEVRPYLLRQVCTNGAIMMRSTAGSSVATVDCTDVWLKEALAVASSEEALAVSASEVRTLAGTSFDRAFMIATFMQTHRGFGNESIREILRRMIGDGSTGYALMNAITSVARDTSDPETRWRLEGAGGAIPAVLLAGPGPRVGFDALDIPNSDRSLDREFQLA